MSWRENKEANKRENKEANKEENKKEHKEKNREKKGLESCWRLVLEQSKERRENVCSAVRELSELNRATLDSLNLQIIDRFVINLFYGQLSR